MKNIGNYMKHIVNYMNNIGNYIKNKKLYEKYSSNALLKEVTLHYFQKTRKSIRGYPVQYHKINVTTQC